MATRDKRLQAMQRNPAHVRFDDVRMVLEDHGFNGRRPEGGSSHWTFSHPHVAYLVTIVQRHPFVNEVYIKKALKALAEVESESNA